MNKTYICKCRSEFEVVKCNLKQKWNNDKYQCEDKNPITYHICREDHVGYGK